MRFRGFRLGNGGTPGNTLDLEKGENKGECIKIMGQIERNYGEGGGGEKSWGRG